MSLDVMDSVEIIEAVENFVENNRPPENMRSQVDLGYKLDNQSVIIYEVRPVWDHPSETQECNVAKATFVKKQQTWKVYWLRANLKWDSYKPAPEVATIKDFLQLVKDDKHACFWG